MNIVTQVQILDDAICVLHSSNTLGKNIHLTILPLAMVEW